MNTGFQPLPGFPLFPVLPVNPGFCMMWVILHFFCYIDGVYTIIDMATAYGTALGLDSTGLLLALLVTQIVAFPSALIFGRLSQKYESKHLIPICIVAYTVIAVFAFFLDSQTKRRRDRRRISLAKKNM